MKVIVLTLRSDFAHWRNPFSISVLETFLSPQKTAVLGIIGAMSGLKEDEIEKIQDNIKVGIKIEELGGICSDLITLINLKEKNLKTPVARQLLVKPKYKLAVCGDDEIISELTNRIKEEIYPVYAGISEMLCEVEVKNVENIEIKKELTTFFNVSIPYKESNYEEIAITNKKLIIPARVYKKTLSFRKRRKEKKFIDILEGFNTKITPSWKVEYITIEGEPFPIF